MFISTVIPARRPLAKAARKGFSGSERSRMFLAMLDWTQCPAVERVPGKVSGAWMFKTTRVPVHALSENLEDGTTVAQYQSLVRSTWDRADTAWIAAKRRFNSEVRAAGLPGDKWR